MPVTEPVEIEITPVLGGLDVSVPPSELEAPRAVELHNVRFRRGQLTSRAGFSTKRKVFVGAVTTVVMSPLETILACTDASASPVVVGFSWNHAFYVNASTTYPGLYKAGICADGTTGNVSTDLSMNLDSVTGYYSMDYGIGGYDFDVANGGNLASNVPLIIFCTNTAMASSSSGYGGGVMVGGFLPAGAVQFEEINFNVSASTDRRYGAPKKGLACAVYDSRAFVGGADDYGTYIQWSAQGRWDGWNASTTVGVGSGYQFVGDNSDKIVAMKRLGDYLVIYKQQSIWMCRKTGISGSPFEFSSVPSGGVGCVAPGSVAEIGENSHAFLGQSDVYSLSSAGVRSIAARARENIFSLGAFPIKTKYINRCKGFFSKEYGEYLLMVPTGRMPEDTGATNGSVKNLLAFSGTGYCVAYGNPCMLGEIGASKTAIGWTLEATPSAYSMETGGLFSGTYQKVAWADAAHKMTSQLYVPTGTIATSKVFSALVWVATEAAASISVSIQFCNVSHAEVNVATATYTTEAGTIIPMAVTGSPGAAVTECRVIITTNTAAAVLHVHGAQLVDITAVSQLAYVTDAAGTPWGVPGIKVYGSRVEKVPLIAKEVGPWSLDTVWCFNVKEDAWSCWTMPLSSIGMDLNAPSSVTIADLSGTVEEQQWRFGDQMPSAAAPSMIFGSLDGAVQEPKEGLTKDYADLGHEQSMLTFWESKSFDFGQPSSDKTFVRLAIRHERTHPAVSVLVSVTSDDWGPSTVSSTVTLNPGGNKEQTYVDFFLTGSHMRFRVESEGALALRGFAAKVILRGESHQYD